MKKILAMLTMFVAITACCTSCSCRTWTEKTIAISEHEIMTADGNIFKVKDVLMYNETYVVSFIDSDTINREDDIIVNITDLETYELNNF